MEPPWYLRDSSLSAGGAKAVQQISTIEPKDAPPGTKPIDQSGLDRGDVHGIKDGIGAGPQDWVGITPNGDVVTTNPDGTAEYHGPASSYTN